MSHSAAMFRIALLCVALIASVGSAKKTAYRPFEARHVWNDQTTARVFDAALVAVHGQQLLIASADSQAGTIDTHWKRVADEDHSGAYRYRLRVKVTKAGKKAVAVTGTLNAQHRANRAAPWQDLAKGTPVPSDSYSELNRKFFGFRQGLRAEIGLWSNKSAQK